MLENFNKLHLNHGVMEVGYMDHQATTVSDRSTSGAVENYQSLSSISMTATLDVKGKLLVGTSRNSGFRNKFKLANRSIKMF